MKMKWGALVTDGRGKIGGHVASKNRSGAYLRTKVTPTNPQTVSQLGVRNNFASLSQGWNGLTEEQRTAWNAAVGDYARTNIFGDLVNPSGKALYQRLNANLFTVGLSPISTPPLPEAVGVVEVTELTVTITGSVFEIELNSAVPANTRAKVFATAPMSAGKSFVKNQYRLIGSQASGGGTTLDFSTEYIEKFGSLGAAGQKIFVKLEAVNSNTGQTGTPSSAYAVVSA